MPASRWWEFEDASVDFGAVDAEPDDLARMLLVDFAITYGNDWFVIPVDVPVGSICKINSLVVTDTFGVRTLIPSIERSAHPASSRWRMFKNSGNADAPTNLFLAPTLKRTLESNRSTRCCSCAMKWPTWPGVWSGSPKAYPGVH